MKALVTGANGFIGRFLVEELLRRGWAVRCFILEGERSDGHESEAVEVVTGDICRKETLAAAVQGVDYIFHLAGVKTVWDEATYFRINVQGTKNLLHALLESGHRIRRFIFASSQAAAGPSPDGHPITEDEACRPLTAYGRSKRAAEEYLLAHSHRVPITILRPVLVYGPRNLETELLLALIRRGWMFDIGRHHQSFNLIYISDVVRAFMLAARHRRAAGEIYFITSRDRYTWRQIAEQSFRVQRRKGHVLSLPWAGVRLAAEVVKSYRKLRGQPFDVIDDKVNELRQAHWVCSGEKARRHLGFEPRVSLAQGIEETMEWYQRERQGERGMVAEVGGRWGKFL